MSQGLGVVGSQAKSAIGQVLGLLNTQFLGSGVFAGSNGTAQPMTSAGGTGGLTSITQSVLSSAVAAKGGPLTSADVNNLINGPDGLSSVFDDTNSDPTKRYSSSIYTGSTDGTPTNVIIGTGQTIQYDSSANQPVFRNLLKGMSMLSMLSAPSTQVDDSARSALLAQAGSLLSQAQNQLTSLQGTLGNVQADLSAASATQKSAATATQNQITSYVQADPYATSTQISMLQTQLQATYALTSQISQLSLVKYMS
jgi:flagellar hook-associated protein 3 FlgL